MLPTKTLILTEMSALFIVENFSEDYYDVLKDVFCYEEPPITIIGRPCNQRRDVAFYSDSFEGYKFR